MASSISRANTNTLWASVLVECLYCAGLRQVVISPGSRSTPLTVAFAAHEGIEAIPVLDERSASFFALGLAKRQHQPIALLCTSGTAAVNYFPAVVEASEARIPLLVLTADRPPELRDCGAGQTIDQIRLYGDYPIFQEEVALPSVAQGILEEMRELVNQSYVKAYGGPVHLNCPFRDPLPPIQDDTVPQSFQLSDSFFEEIEKPPVPQESYEAIKIEISASRGFILCGTESPQDPGHYCEAVADLARDCGWPILADGLSPVRNFDAFDAAPVVSYDLILRNCELRSSLRPECVIALGPLPTSKELRKWLEESEVEIYHVHRTGKNLDPTGKVVRVVEQPIDDLSEILSFSTPQDEAYAGRWNAAQARATQGLEKSFQEVEAVGFEGRLAWDLPKQLPKGTPIFVASSMPVRDVEYFWPHNRSEVSVYASRGANGIDGTLSTALGIAHGHRPTVLLTGDLAFLHDSNGLLIRPKFEGHLTVLLINNHGGGIFNHLPIAKFEPPFEEYFATPQEVDYKLLAESLGCDYRKIEDLVQLGELLNPLPESGIRVIEVETDRHRDSEYRRHLFRSISQSLV